MARRLIDAFASLDPENFTANELADTYRLSSRSARRLISLLREHRLVEECGIDKLNGPGRPTRAYRIALSRLAEALPHARASR
jgi:DNA-binding IclR family transcriptional regulator